MSKQTDVSITSLDNQDITPIIKAFELLAKIDQRMKKKASKEGAPSVGEDNSKT